MKYLIIAAAVLMAGCSESNEQIIATHKQCEAAGMDTKVTHGMFYYRVAFCEPRYVPAIARLSKQLQQIQEQDK